MATTTPNFGWPVPTSTDLVKDGAVAIETLGDSIDADLEYLQGGTTGQVLAKASGTDMDFTWAAAAASPLTTKGDLFTFDTADARLAVGANGTVLTADSAEATGLKWATPASGSRTLINTGGTLMNGVSTITISSIPGTFQSLFIIIDDYNGGTAGGNLLLRPNNSTGGDYISDNRFWSANGSGSATISIDATSFLLGTNVSSINGLAAAQVTIDNYTSTTAGKPISARGIQLNQTTSANAGFTVNGGWYNAAAISSLTIFNSAGTNWSTGITYVYGVN